MKPLLLKVYLSIHNYVHYECTFPNEDVSFLLSGNYMLIVYNDETQEVILKKSIRATYAF